MIFFVLTWWIINEFEKDNEHNSLYLGERMLGYLSLDIICSAKRTDVEDVQLVFMGVMQGCCLRKF